MNPQIIDVLHNALRAVYLVGLPIVAVLTITSGLASILQTALGMNEHTLNFAMRLIALIVLLYIFTPAAADTLTGLAKLSLR